jgi:hypothetical protein
MARAISASAERKPKARRVSSRILVLTDSIKALDRPWSSVVCCGGSDSELGSTLALASENSASEPVPVF